MIFRKRKVIVMVQRKKRGLFGSKEVLEPRYIKLDRKTYKEWKKRSKSSSEPIRLDEMIFYDEIYDD